MNPGHGWEGVPALITGGLGTIGSNLAHRLAALGARITLLDAALPYSGAHPRNIEGLPSPATLLRADMRDDGVLDRAVAGQSVIFNLAGLGCHRDSMASPLTDLEMNVRAHVLLLETCRRVNPDACIVYASTRQIYGCPRQLPVTETHPARPVDVNGIHKLAAEQYHLLYHRVHGLRACALRLTNVMGPRMRIRDARQVFYGAWVRSLIEGRPFQVWGGAQLRDIIAVADVVDACLAAATHDCALGEAFNIGQGQAVSLRQLADLFVACWPGARYQVMDLPAEQRRIDIGDYVGSIDKAQALLEWRPRTDTAAMVAGTLEYYRAHGAAYLAPAEGEEEP